MRKKIKYSIVIPLAPWREAPIIQYIKKQDYSKQNYEVIIKKGLNVPDNRNEGVELAKGEIIIFLDDDATIERDFLNNVDDFFNAHPEVDILGGPQLTPKSDGYFARLNGYALSSMFVAAKESRRYRRGSLCLDADSSYLTGALLIIRKEVFRRIKFDRDIYPSDDVHFVNLAKKNGFKIAYSPNVYLHHMRRPDIGSLVKQIYDYARVRTIHSFPPKEIKDLLYFIPLIFLFYVAMLPTLFLINRLFLIPALMYLMLSLCFSAYSAIKERDFLAFLALPFVFAVIHFSYGAGFAAGLIKRFEKKKND